MFENIGLCLILEQGESQPTEIIELISFQTETIWLFCIALLDIFCCEKQSPAEVEKWLIAF